MRTIGDDGPHIAYCIQCGILNRGTYGKCESEAAIHRTTAPFKTVYTLTADSFEPRGNYDGYTV